MGQYIWIDHPKVEHQSEEGVCMDCQQHPDYQPTCKECNGTGIVEYEWQVNSYSFNGRNMPDWLFNATKYYHQLTHSQCHSLACEIQMRMDNGEKLLSHFVGEDEPIDRLPMYANMFESLAKEAKKLNCLVYIG